MLFRESSARLVAGLVLFYTLTNSLSASAQVPLTEASFKIPPVNCTSPTENKLLLASHAGDSSAANLGAAEILGTQKGSVSNEMMSDSLWGNLLLQMAFARDPQLSKSAKKLKLADSLTLASVYAISGLSLAQGITTLATLNPSAPAGGATGMTTAPAAESAESGEHTSSTSGGESSGGHGEGGEAKQSSVPGVLSLIASGSTIVSLGLRFYFGRRYSKQIKLRQRAIKAKIENILAQLENGVSLDQLRVELTSLVGERATKEFGQLWRSSHQVASASPSPS